MSHYFRRRRTKRNSFLEKKKLLKNLHINIVRQSFWDFDVRQSL